ncbi:MAG: Panacea domain-containing protein [Acidiferrobacter sp.]
MTTVRDVAAYILQKQGRMTTMKLQKLVYYSQAWSLVWDEKPLFSEKIEAWANGPVCPELYGYHRGFYTVDDKEMGGNSSVLEPEEKETVDAVLEYYGEKSAQWLSDLTHLEAPWNDARGGCQRGELCTTEITHASMAEFYSSLAYDEP